MEGDAEIMLNIAICDNEKHFSEDLKCIVSKYMDSKNFPYKICHFSSGQEFIALGSAVSGYQIVFLDINMEFLNGIEAAKKLRKLCDDIYLVFVTSYLSYALEGYKVNAVRCLLKGDLDFEESVHECLNAIFYKMNRIPKALLMKFKEGEKRISVHRLLFIESNLHKLTVHVLEEALKGYTLNGTLDDMEEMFRSENFIRIHQSFLVNPVFISHIEKRDIVLADGTKLPISKSRYKQVLEDVMRYKEKD